MLRTLVALCLLSGLAHADSATDAKIKALEARIQTLETTLAKYRESLEFLEKVYEQQKAQAAASEREEIAPDGVYALDIADDIKNNQVIGSPNAGVTVVWVFDFACPYCARARSTANDVLAAYKDKVRIVMKNLVVHPQIVTQAHLAGCAAGKQKKFKEFYQTWFDDAFEKYVAERDPKALGDDAIDAVAKKVKLDLGKLRADMTGSCGAFIKADEAELAKFHVNATPTFFINGKPLRWDGTKESFTKAIDEQLAIVAKSKVAPAKYYEQVVMKTGEKQFRSKADRKP